MRDYTVRIFFIDGSRIDFDCDDISINAQGSGYYYALRDGKAAMTAPLSSVKYTMLICNKNDGENDGQMDRI